MHFLLNHELLVKLEAYFEDLVAVFILSNYLFNDLNLLAQFNLNTQKMILKNALWEVLDTLSGRHLVPSNPPPHKWFNEYKLPHGP